MTTQHTTPDQDDWSPPPKTLATVAIASLRRAVMNAIDTLPNDRTTRQTRTELERANLLTHELHYFITQQLRSK